MVQPRDARKIPLTPRGSSVRVPEKKSEWKSTTAPIWRDGGWGTKSALDHVACAFGSARLSSSLSAPRYPPWGPLAKVLAATAANRPLRGRLGPGAGPTVRLVAHSEWPRRPRCLR